MERGFLYLVAVLDWYSRYVVSWRLSNTMDTSFCVAALSAALKQAVPEIFNTDQAAQFTAADFVDRLLDAGIRVSMDGRGRALDNVFIEFRNNDYYEHGINSNFAQNGLDKGVHFINGHRLGRITTGLSLFQTVVIPIL